MPSPKEELYTTDFIYNLPDGERAELIDGQIYYMAPPTFTHQRLLHYISTEMSFQRQQGYFAAFFNT